MNEIADPDALRAHFGPVSMLARRKKIARLDRHCRSFIALSPFLVIATADADGHADASPRGDAPGFVRVLDDVTLLLPDRPGNNLVDSYANTLANPGVGLIFLVPGIDETLRVNGTARIVTDPALLEGLAAQGKIPRTGLLIDVREAFFHCGKALKRARLWDPAQQVERARLPSLGRIIADQTGDCDAAEADARVEESYRTRLY